MSLPIVLIVDDRQANLLVLSSVLEGLDAELELVKTGQEALDAAAAREPALVLLDVRMPGMDGHEVAHRLRALPGRANVPIIFVTANDEDDRPSRSSCVEGVQDEYISKPIDADVVRSKVEAHLQAARRREH